MDTVKIRNKSQWGGVCLGYEFAPYEIKEAPKEDAIKLLTNTDWFELAEEKKKKEEVKE